MSEDGLPPLRAVIAAHGLAARKGLGQHFLLDLNLTRRIARAADLASGAPVVEIGPGPGGLTRALLLEGAGHVLAIEKDARCLSALGEIAAAYPGRLTVLEADALAVDIPAALSRAGQTTPAQLVANLPYNIATPLLVRWIKAEPWPPWWRALTVMVQKEVASRLCAEAGTSDYGRLTVLAAARACPRRLFDIGPQAFVPPPKVVSTVLRLEPRAEAPDAATMAALERVTAAAFGQRRKMLRTSLKGAFPAPEGVLESLGLKSDARAETLTPADFLALARRLGASS
ncbi:MAG: 16S rRNA (adenine(1518)-N(6)/adenine(1519)-N(6))-dimethyltransferase RsmA [Alphaproteobacteria bacterium]|nr:16S rRNA (adenine(1518)-N(6)/adenine(1519)-N(6))-dimethyltransferase RsmA [Alphaproteobacteria bacterium]